MKNKIYLAYGSNLNLEQMAYRCPTAIPIGTTELRGYDLKFRGHRNAAVATVEPGEGNVPALLWTITPADEVTLDRYEGLPHLYRKETVEVQLNGESVDAMVYVMNDGHEFGAPTESYYNSIKKGYADAGFDVGFLDKSVELSRSKRSIANDELREKLDRNMADFKEEWYAMSPEELVEDASMIAVTKLAHEEMYNAFFTTEDAERLLRYENPLEITRDYAAGQGYPEYLGDAIDNMLYEETHFDGYALDPQYVESEPEPEFGAEWDYI